MSIEDKLRETMLDPGKSQFLIMEEIGNRLNNEALLIDSTSPFSMLLEMNSISTSNAVKEGISNLEDYYPTMANDNASLFKHLTEATMKNVFSTPAKTKMLFQVSYLELLENGFNANGTIKTTIPKFTEVEVSGITLTLLNDINIFITQNSVYVEQVNADNNYAVKDLGNLQCGITEDENGVKWIVFETELVQVKRYYREDNIVLGTNFNLDLPVKDKYWYSEIKNKKNGKWNILNTTHTNLFLEESPTIFINYGYNKISYNLPIQYTINGGVEGLISTEMFETLGEITLPLNKIPVENFKIILPNIIEGVETTTIKQISLQVSSRFLLSGGSNGKTFDELKTLAINNKPNAGKEILTEVGINDIGSRNGFTVFKDIDSLGVRTFNVYKKLPSLLSKDIDTNVQTLTGKIKVGLSSVNKDILFRDNKIVIKNNSYLKNVNGVCKPLNTADKEIVNNGYKTLIKNDSYFTTAFTTMLNIDKLTVKNYVTNKPTITDLNIISKHVHSNLSVNIDKYLIKQIDTGYEISFNLLGNSVFDNFNKVNLKMQLIFDIVGSSEKVYLHANYVNGLFTFKIDTDFILDKDVFTITGESNVTENLINFKTNVGAVIYTEELNVIVNGPYDVTGLLKFTNTINPTALTMETLTVDFIQELPTMNGYLSKTFGENKYLKRTYDKPLFYTEDVYEVNPDGNIFTAVDSNGDGVCDTLTYNKLHSKGDIVVDSNGATVYEFKTGDLILENGLPKLDNIGQVEYLYESVLLPIEYTFSNTLHKNVVKDNLDLIEQWCFNELHDLQDVLIENSTLNYVSGKKVTGVKINVNGVEKVVNNKLTLEVNIYTNDFEFVNKFELSYLKKIIGKFIDSKLDMKVIDFNTIGRLLIDELKNGVVGCTLTNVPGSIITVLDNANGFVLDRKLNKDIVEYNLSINIFNV